MKLQQLITLSIGVVACGLAVFVYSTYIDMLGFPDGFISELGYAQRNLAVVFVSISVFFGCVFFALGRVAGRKRIGTRLAGATAVYLLSSMLIWLLNQYLQVHLVNASGG